MGLQNYLSSAEIEFEEDFPNLLNYEFDRKFVEIVLRKIIIKYV